MVVVPATPETTLINIVYVSNFLQLSVSYELLNNLKVKYCQMFLAMRLVYGSQKNIY